MIFNLEEVKTVLNIINNCTQGFKALEDIDHTLAIRYEQQLEDIQKWLSITEWNDGKPLTKEDITDIQNKMIGFNVINEKIDTDKLIRNLYI